MDSSFGGGDGIYKGESGEEFNDVAVQADGKIVAAGQYDLPGNEGPIYYQFLTQRFTASGESDASFASGGKALTSFQAVDTGRAVSVAPDGRVVTAGVLQDATKAGIARYTNEGVAIQQADGSLRVSGGPLGESFTVTDLKGSFEISRAMLPSGQPVTERFLANVFPKLTIVTDDPIAPFTQTNVIRFVGPLHALPAAVDLLCMGQDAVQFETGDDPDTI